VRRRSESSRFPELIATAHISAVFWVSVVAALTLAPRAISAFTTATLPVCVAVISGVIPLS